MSGLGGWPNTNDAEDHFATFGGHGRNNRDGTTGRNSPTGQDPAPSFLTQDGSNLRHAEWSLGKCVAGVGSNSSFRAYGYTRYGDYAVNGMLTPSYGPSRPYDPDQKPEGLGISMVPTPASGIGLKTYTVRQPSENLHGNNWNGNDIRIIENCEFHARNGSAINCIVRQPNQKPEMWMNMEPPSGVLERRRGYVNRTMTVLLKNNVIIHKFSAHAYPVESGMYDNGRGWQSRVFTDISHEPVTTTLGGTYVQSNRTLTGSGSFGTNLPSWVKRNSKVIFHHNHACSGVEYDVDQRVSSSSLILSAASNPGSNVGPGASFEIRPRLYHGPGSQAKASWLGYEMSPISIKFQAVNGGSIEAWMQNNTIIAHPDACVNENNTYYGALRQGHGYGPGTSGHIKSFDAKYIAIANITMTQPVITNPSGPTICWCRTGKKLVRIQGFCNLILI